MISNKNLIREVLAQYDNEKNEREYLGSLSEKRLLENPEYEKIADEYSVKFLQCAKAEFENNGEDHAELKGQLNLLKKEKTRLEREFGLNENAFTPKCSICQDEGYVENGYCHCFYERLTDVCYSQLGATSPELFSFDKDSLKKDLDLEKLYEKVKKYATNFENQTKNIIFTGKAGTGKTYLSQAIASEIAKKDKVVLYLSSIDLNNIFVENMYSSPFVAKTINDIIASCDFLVIDDLGAERILNKVTGENIYTLISERLNNKKPFLITTNLSLNEIAEKYGDRVFSRLTGKSTVVFNFSGKDLRKVDT